MKGFTPLVLGILATLAFSWLGLAYIPDLQIGHLDPQSDEEGTDVYPAPTSGMRLEKGIELIKHDARTNSHAASLEIQIRDLAIV